MTTKTSHGREDSCDVEEAGGCVTMRRRDLVANLCDAGSRPSWRRLTVDHDPLRCWWCCDDAGSARGAETYRRSSLMRALHLGRRLTVDQVDFGLTTGIRISGLSRKPLTRSHF
ncbi:hypothetical protein ACJJTC_010187 [Scirpophaga incertulas]